MLKAITNWLSDRKKEPTTYIGLALLVQGVGALAKIDDAPMIADTIHQAATPLAAGDYAGAGTLLLGGILGMLMREKGKK